MRTRLDELEDLDHDAWTEALKQEADRAVERLDEIDEIEREGAVYSDAQRAIAGCIVTLDYQGKVTVEAGLVRPQDIPADEPPASTDGKDGDATGGAEETSGESGSEESVSSVVVAPPRSVKTPPAPVDPVTAARKEKGISRSLADDLRATRHQILQAHLCADYDAAFDTMVYVMCRQAFASGYEALPLDVTLKPAMVEGSRDVLQESIAAAVLAELYGLLRLDWLSKPRPQDFEALCALDDADKRALFAWCTAHALDQQLSTDSRAHPVFELLGQRMAVDVAKFWRPTVETYWGRVKKDHALDVARDLIGDDWANDRSHYKKALLAKSMEACFADDAGERVGMSPQGATRTAAWLPEGMSFAYEVGDELTGADSALADNPPEASIATPCQERRGNPPENAGTGAADADPAASDAVTPGGVDLPDFLRGQIVHVGGVGRQFILTVRRQLPLRGGNSLSSSIFRQQLAEKDDELSRKRGTDSHGCIVETGAFPERSGAASRGYGGHGSISSQAPIGGRIGW